MTERIMLSHFCQIKFQNPVDVVIYQESLMFSQKWCGTFEGSISLGNKNGKNSKKNKNKIKSKK